MNEALHDQLLDACERIMMIRKYNQAIQNLEDKKNELYADYERTKKKGFSAVPGVLILIFSSIFLWIVGFFVGFIILDALRSDILLSLLQIGMTLVAFIIPVFPITYKLTICRSKNKKIDKENDEYFSETYMPLFQENEQNIVNLAKERDEFIASTEHLLDFLPGNYRSDLAIAYMEKVVRTGRADTLKEAMNLFEEQLHRWTLESQGQQLLEQNAIQTQMINDKLWDIENNQRRIASSLRSIESLEFYNTFCR